MASFGEILKRERELRDISLRQVAEATKISIRYLEALEQGRFDILPGGLFNKGFIRAYCTYIGLDGEAMVTSYLQVVADHQVGLEPGTGQRPDPALHRPASVPQRRTGAPAGPRPAAASPVAAAPVPQPPRFRSENQIEALRAALDGRRGQPVSTARTAARVDEPGGSRALVWILSVAAGIALLFVLLSLFRRPAPPRENPVAAGVSEPAGPAVAGAGEVAVSEPPATAEVPPDHGRRPDEPKHEPAPRTQIATATLGSLPAAERTPPGPMPTPHPLPPEDRETAAPAPPEAAPPMDLEVAISGRTRVIVMCDGRQQLDRSMQAGEIATMRCDTLIRISAGDASFVRLRVNGRDCLPLGEAGTPVYGYTIRRDDYRAICAPVKQGDHGR